jgi:hypothetical protein
MPQFNDSENKTFELLPPGDYVFQVTEFEIGISNGGKTSGSDKYDMKLAIDKGDGVFVEVRENMIDHPSCAWKIDTFLKSAGVDIKKGDAFEFRQDVAQDKDVLFVDPIGLRGWCHIKNEAGTNDPTKKFNKVSTFYTTKEKLPPIRIGDEDAKF